MPKASSTVGREAGRDLYGIPGVDSHLDKDTYCAMAVAIQKALLPRFHLKPDPNYDPREDWECDSKGKPKMDFPDYFDAMFELADGEMDANSENGYNSQVHV